MAFNGELVRYIRKARICTNCRKIYLDIHRFGQQSGSMCSDPCRHKARYRKRHGEITNCEGCGGRFRRYRPNNRYCCNACIAYAYRQRKLKGELQHA